MSRILWWNPRSTAIFLASLIESRLQHPVSFLLDPDIRSFHEYNSMHMEPWDGPAGIVMSDGDWAICVLDRNGLRPARFQIDTNNIISIASETGINPIDDLSLIHI